MSATEEKQRKKSMYFLNPKNLCIALAVHQGAQCQCRLPFRNSSLSLFFCILFIAEEHMESGRMVLKQVEIGPMMNFAYVIGCSETREAAVVDPSWDAPALIKIAEDSDLKIKHILLTHGHPDHVNALEQLLEITDARIYIHKDEVDYMREAARSFGMSTEFMSHKSGNFQKVSDGDSILVGKLSVQCLHTPGHSPGSQCFLVEGCLFSGDTLFVDACGRVDMPGGEPEKMWWSLNQRLRALDESTLVYPGHDYGGSPTSTIGEQKKTNPYMNYDSVQNFLRDMSYM
jgi:glyoxylase-like metal-dependent hydrolase (beta-lactamase superfamily II)